MTREEHDERYIKKVAQLEAWKKRQEKIEFKWINNFTGEVYTSLWHAAATIAKDMTSYEGCRTIKMLDISRYYEV